MELSDTTELSLHQLTTAIADIPYVISLEDMAELAIALEEASKLLKADIYIHYTKALHDS